MTNTAMLEEAITRSGLKKGFIAAQLGLTYQGFYNKVNGAQEFRQGEINRLRELLGLTRDQAEAIFFNQSGG